MAIDRTGISSLDAGASDITYSGNEGPKSPQEEQQMMLAQLEQEYEQYRMEQMEIDPSKVLSFQDWYQATYEASRQGVASGGIARLGYRGGQLVKPGPGRPGYQGPAGGSHDSYGGTSAPYGGGSDRGPRDDPDRFGYTQQPPKTIHHPGLDTTVVPTPVKIGHDPVPIPKDDDGIIKNILDSRTKAAFNASLLIPGQTKRTKKYRKAYKDYLVSMGIVPPSSLDDDDLSNFWVNDAFSYEPGAADAGMPEAMDYGDFLLEKFNNPTVKYRGDLGAYKREMGLGGDGPANQYPYYIPPGTTPGDETDETAEWEAPEIPVIVLE